MLVRENGVHSLVIEPVTSRDAGIYTCIASNRAGQNSFNLELIVAGECLWQQRSLQPRGLKPSVPTAREMHKAPSFVEKLQNTSVAEGHPVRLECRVTGVPYPQIFWKRENESFTHNTDRIRFDGFPVKSKVNDVRVNGLCSLPACTRTTAATCV